MKKSLCSLQKTLNTKVRQKQLEDVRGAGKVLPSGLDPAEGQQGVMNAECCAGEVG